MIVYVSMFGALPVSRSVCDGGASDCKTIGDLCDTILADTIWDVTLFAIDRAEKLSLHWEAELSLAAGPSADRASPVSADTPLATLSSSGHVLFVNFENSPPNITSYEVILVASRRLMLPDVCEMTVEHMRVLARFSSGKEWPRVVQVAGRFGSMNILVYPSMTFDEFESKIAEQTRMPALSCSFVSYSGRAIRNMHDVRAVSRMRVAFRPPLSARASAGPGGNLVPGVLALRRL
jgi:hypothetical protein